MSRTFTRSPTSLIALLAVRPHVQAAQAHFHAQRVALCPYPLAAVVSQRPLSLTLAQVRENIPIRHDTLAHGLQSPLRYVSRTVSGVTLRLFAAPHGSRTRGCGHPARDTRRHRRRKRVQDHRKRRAGEPDYHPKRTQPGKPSRQNLHRSRRQPGQRPCPSTCAQGQTAKTRGAPNDTGDPSAARTHARAHRHAT